MIAQFISLIANDLRIQIYLLISSYSHMNISPENPEL